MLHLCVCLRIVSIKKSLFDRSAKHVVLVVIVLAVYRCNCNEKYDNQNHFHVLTDYPRVQIA